MHSDLEANLLNEGEWFINVLVYWFNIFNLSAPRFSILLKNASILGTKSSMSIVDLANLIYLIEFFSLRSKNYSKATAPGF